MAARQLLLKTSQSKRLIAKGLASWDTLRKVYKDGIIVIAKGTTNRYVAEEILGVNLSEKKFAWGLVAPSSKIQEKEDIQEIVIIDGQQRDMQFAEAIESMSQGDIFIKGGNALDYSGGEVGVLSNSPVGGTIGSVYSRIIGSRITMVIPIGLEKSICSPIDAVCDELNSPIHTANKVPTMYKIKGKIFTEIEALKELLDLRALHISSGGVSDYRGSVRLLVRGDPQKVKAVGQLENELDSEPPYLQ